MNSLSGINVSSLENLQAKEVEKNSNGELGQSDFLELLVAQLQNQNPLEPKDGSEFLGQVAQFGTLDGINKMSENIESLSSSFQSSQALQASTLVGRKVSVASNVGTLKPGGVIEGSVKLTESVGDLTITIQDPQGETVKQIKLGVQPAGEVPFRWAGINDNEEGMPGGHYSIHADALSKGERISFATNIFSNVDSVTLAKDKNEMMLNLAGIGQKSLSEIKTLR